MIDASFEEVKFAINNDLQDLQGMQAVSAPLKIATWFLVRALNIYHNIRCPHRLRALQRVSEASGLKHTPFCDHIEKKPLMILARLHGYARTYLAGILAAKIRWTPWKPPRTTPITVNGCAIYCVAVRRCRRSRKTRFQHVQEGGRCTNGSGNGSEVIR